MTCPKCGSKNTQVVTGSKTNYNQLSCGYVEFFQRVEEQPETSVVEMALWLIENGLHDTIVKTKNFYEVPRSGGGYVRYEKSSDAIAAAYKLARENKE